MRYDIQKVHAMIYGRRSVRSYADTVDMDELAEAVEMGLQGAASLPGHTKPTVQVMNGDGTEDIFTGIMGRYGKVTAPAYLVVSARPAGDYLVQTGYVVEQLVLWLAAMGYGTCWIGIPLNTQKILELCPLPEGEKYVILLAVGKPAAGTPLLRDIGGYKRKALAEIIAGEMRPEWKPLLEAARLAPSASNGQPWRFVCDERGICLYGALASGPIKKKYYHHLNRIDCGIALAHLYLAARQAGYDVSLESIDVPAAGSGKHREDRNLTPIMGVLIEKRA